MHSVVVVASQNILSVYTPESAIDRWMAVHGMLWVFFVGVVCGVVITLGVEAAIWVLRSSRQQSAFPVVDENPSSDTAKS